MSRWAVPKANSAARRAKDAHEGRWAVPKAKYQRSEPGAWAL